MQAVHRYTGAAFVQCGIAGRRPIGRNDFIARFDTGHLSQVGQMVVERNIDGVLLIVAMIAQEMLQASHCVLGQAAGTAKRHRQHFPGVGASQLQPARGPRQGCMAASMAPGRQ